jgi:hypothetical protein
VDLLDGRPRILRTGAGQAAILAREPVTCDEALGTDERFTPSNLIGNGLIAEAKIHEMRHEDLDMMWYNFARIHKTLRVTPAMEAGVSNHVWSAAEIAQLAD